MTGPPVLFEVAWTLQAAYGLPRERVLDVLSRILALPGLAMTDAQLVERALQLARAANRDFADAYIAASAKVAGIDGIATFNSKDLRRLGSAIYDF